MTQIIANRYVLQAKLGAGGMGEVYRAYDRLTGQTVALKRVLVTTEQLLFQSRRDEINLRVALAREFQTLASLRHPNIISVLDYGFDLNNDQQPFFTMTLLEDATSLRRAAEKRDLRGKVQLLVQVLQALAYLHRHDIIHRDLKAGNVLVDPQGQVKLLDFGLAIEANFTREISGTLEYMAPEILEGKGASYASDLYAVGVIAYDLLAYRHPYSNQNVLQMVEEILTIPVDFEPFLRVVDPQYNEQLVAIIDQLLAKNPADRPRDAMQVIQAFSSVLSLPLATESVDIRESFLQSARFVGRENELTTLTGALQQTLNGQGSAWLVGGESGVGKSRLLDELRTQALVRGALVFRGQGVEGGGLPYQVWREVASRLVLTTPPTDLQAGILQEIVPDIATLLGREIPAPPSMMGQSARERLIHTLLDLLPRQPTVLILEDLHWADESLLPIKALLVRLDSLPILLVGSYRDDERPDLPAELPDMREIKLGRLSDQAIATLCSSMIGQDAVQRSQVLDLITRESEGNTFFIVEVVRALAEEAGSMADIGERTLPPSVFTGGVAQIVQRRLRRVPDWGQAWLKLAAVAGRHLDLNVLRYLSNMSTDLRRHTLDEWLGVCTDVAVLEVSDNQWRFTHDKLRDGVLRQLNPIERKVLHRAVAEAIEAVYPFVVAQHEILMEHWRLADNPEKELDYLLPVSEKWVDYRAAYQPARRILERALTLLDENDPRTLTVLNRLGETCYHLGDYEASEQAVQQAYTIAERNQNIHELMLALYGLGMVSQRQGNNAHAHDYYGRSLKYAQELGEMRGASYTLTAMGILHWYEGNFKQSEDDLTLALQIQKELGDQRGIVRILGSLGAICWQQGEYEIAREYFQNALDIAEHIDHRSEIAQNHFSLGEVYQRQGEYELAPIQLHKSLKIYQEIGNMRGVAKCLHNLGINAIVQNNSAQAHDYYERSLAITLGLNDRYGIAINLSSLGNLLESEQDYAGAQNCYEQSLDLRRSINDRNGVADTLNHLSRLLMLIDPQAQVSAWLGEAVRLSHAIGSLPVLLATLVTVARWLLHHQLPALALECAALVVQHPATDSRTRHAVSTLFPALEDALNKDNLHTELEKGKTTDLNQLIDGLLETLSTN